MSLLTHPLLLIGVTMAVLQFSTFVHERCRRTPVLQPLFLSIAGLIGFLALTGIPYDTYRDGTSMLHQLLGPATVAMAIPLYENLKRARASLRALLATLLVGGGGVLVIGIALGRVFGVDHAAELSLLTRSVTTPVALAVAEGIGSNAPLAMLGVFVTGIGSVVVIPVMLRLLRIEDERVQGFTLGLMGHALGVSKALEVSNQAAALVPLQSLPAGGDEVKPGRFRRLR
jgi:putative effector of murein hydrolase